MFGSGLACHRGRRELAGHVDEERRHKRSRRILEKDDGGRTACRTYDGGQRAVRSLFSAAVTVIPERSRRTVGKPRERHHGTHRG